MRMLTLLCALLLAVGLPACGGSSVDDDGGGGGSAAAAGDGYDSQEPGSGGGESGQSDEQAVKEAIATYGKAVVDGDGGQACGMVTDKLEQEMVRLAQSADGSIQSCEDAVDVAAQHMTDEQADALVNPAFEAVEVNRATATVRVKEGMGTPRLTKQGGRWLLAQLR